jgi:hypothetical protein
MIPTDEMEERRRRFVRDCVTGFRQYHLQSENLPGSLLGTVDRWASYDSLSRQWGMGWCAHHYNPLPGTDTAY